eukprot:6150878-Pleurochrysis_carterae.AAC.1
MNHVKLSPESWFHTWQPFLVPQKLQHSSREAATRSVYLRKHRKVILRARALRACEYPSMYNLQHIQIFSVKAGTCGRADAKRRGVRTRETRNGCCRAECMGGDVGGSHKRTGKSEGSAELDAEGLRRCTMAAKDKQELEISGKRRRGGGKAFEGRRRGGGGEAEKQRDVDVETEESPRKAGN